MKQKCFQTNDGVGFRDYQQLKITRLSPDIHSSLQFSDFAIIQKVGTLSKSYPAACLRLCAALLAMAYTIFNVKLIQLSLQTLQFPSRDRDSFCSMLYIFQLHLISVT